MNSKHWVHPQAICDCKSVGKNTRIWGFSHVMKRVVIGKDCNIGEHVFVESGVKIGDRVTIKNGVQLWEGVTIEDDVFVGPSVVFTNDKFPRSPRSAVALKRYADKGWLVKTKVCRGASIGAGAILLPGIEIGSYATVAAGAVVTSSVLPGRLVMGSPAREEGYVCVCGRVLAESSCCLTCEACGRAYELVKGLLKPARRSARGRRQCCR